MGRSDRTIPTQAEYAAYRSRFSNWGRWPASAELGTLNHITPRTRLDALQAARTGTVVSLARPVDTKPSPLNPFPAQHVSAMPGSGGIADYIGMYFHGFAQTHLDALNHVGAGGGRFFDGVDGSIHHWATGIVTRGVLYDIPRLRGVDYVAPGEPVHSWELDDAAAAQGIEPRPGDAVIIRCARDAHLDHHPVAADFGVEHGRGANAGVHASVLEFLHDTDASLLCWDMLDAPTEDQRLDNPLPIATPVHLHAVAIPHMGLPLLDNADLEPLAAACNHAQRWEFLFVVAPLVIRGGTGSPVNPIAVL